MPGSWLMPGASYANPFANRKLSVIEQLAAENSPESVLGLLSSQLDAPQSVKDWLRGSYGQLYNQYKGEAINPDAPASDWFDWLGRQDIGKLYGKASPTARGERTGNFMLGTRLIR